MTKSVAVRATLAATVLTVLLIGLLELNARLLGDQTPASNVQGTLLTWLLVSFFAWPTFLALALLFLVWPGALRKATSRATIFLVVCSAFLVGGDIWQGKPSPLSGLEGVWLIAWPISFGVSLIHIVGAKLGHRLVEVIRGTPSATPR